MARKSVAQLPPQELTQAQIESEHTKHTQTLDTRPTHRGRLRNVTSVPTGDVSGGELMQIIGLVLEVNLDAWQPKWQRVEGTAISATCQQWAQIIVMALRYGSPVDEYNGEGWHIYEDEGIGDPPLCQSCEDEEE